jgi:alpha-tubulin suppressor-like RCC1 family protein
MTWTNTQAISAPGENVVAIAAHDNHTCIVDADETDGTAICWGNDGTGQLGRGVVDTGAHFVGVPVGGAFSPNPVDATTIATGLWHSCALRNHGLVTCWGRGDAGQLLDNGSRDTTRPY